MIINLLFFFFNALIWNIQYFFLFHFIWSTKNVNTCSQCSNMWGLQHLWPLFLETYLVISQNVDPVFPNKAKARNSLIFQLSSRQIISTKLKFHQSDATSWESNPVVSIMGWGGGLGRAAAPRRIISWMWCLLFQVPCGWWWQSSGF